MIMKAVQRLFLAPGVLIVFLALAACSATSTLGGSATDGTDTGDTGTTDAGGNSVDPLTEQEGSLYEDGPVSLPVTISRLKSVGSDYITAEYSDSGITTTVPQLMSDLRTTTSGAGYSVTVAAGGVEDPTTTPKLIGSNLSTDESVIVDVADDGSTSFDMVATEGDVILVSPMTEDESTIAPPIYISVQNGVVAKFYTNTDTLFSESNILSADDHLYFTVTYSEALSIYRRNLDGSPLEIVSAEAAIGTGASLKYISVASDTAVFMDGNGKVWSTGLSAETEWSDPVEIYDMVTVPTYEAALGTDGSLPIKIFQASDGGVFVARSRQGASTSLSDALLVHIDPDTGTATALVSKTDYSILLFDAADQDTVYAVGQQNSTGQFILYRVNLLDGALAWTNKVTLDYRLGVVVNPASAWVRSFDVSESGFGVIGYNDSSGGVRFYSVAENTTPTLLYTNVGLGAGEYEYQSQFVYVSPTATSSSGYFLTCATANEHFSVYRFGDPSGNFFTVDNTLLGYDCERPFAIDDSDRLVFYSWFLADESLHNQVTVVEMDTLDIDNLPVEYTP